MPYRGVDGCRVHYRDAGQGPVVLCLHSSSSHSGQFKALGTLLEDRFRVIAPDLMGYGRSDPLPDAGPLRSDSSVVHAFLEDEGPAHIVGHSLGGAVAFCAARGRADVHSLTLIEPALFSLLSEAGHPTSDEPVRLQAMLDGANAAQEDIARGFMTFWSGPDAYDRLDDDLRAYVIKTMPRVAAEGRDLIPKTHDGPTLAHAAAMKMPVHLVRGGQSRALAHGIVDVLADALPNVEISEIAGARHMAAATHPDLVNPHIAAFLDAQPRE